MTASWTLTLAAVALGAALGAAVPLPATGPPVGAAQPLRSAVTGSTSVAAVDPSVPAVPARATEVRGPPVDSVPVRAFEAPEHAYGPGHRGVDLPAAHGAHVLAPASGTVTFAGPVAGRQVTVLQHLDGSVSSLEPVRAVVARGAPVRAGQLVGRVEAPGDAYAHCHVSCVHWGVRVGGNYVDPWAWLGRGGKVRLLPVGP